MNWLHGGALALLLLIPLILIFYLMKLKRKELPVSCAFLWNKAMEEAKVDSFFQKLRSNLLLFLQLLFIILLAASLARPYIKSLRNLPPRMIFVLDCSASMEAREGRKTRFELAREQITHMVEGAQRGTFFVLITATSRTRLETGFTDDKQAFLTILRGIQPRDTGTVLEPALALATSLVKTHPDAQIFLFSDGGGDLPSLWSRYGGVLHYEPVGKSVRNLGITAFDMRKTRKGFQLFLTVKNFSPQPENTLISLMAGTSVREAREVALAPGEQKSYIFDITGDQSGSLEAVLDMDDDLPVDNRVFAVIPAVKPTQVLLVTGGNPFLEKLLQLMSGCEVRKTPSPSGKDLAKADLVIWDSTEVKKLPEGRAHLFLHCRFPEKLITTKGPVKLPGGLSWDKSHPVNRFLDYSTLTVAEADQITLPPWGKALVSSDRTPLIMLLEKGSHRSIATGFDAYRSDLFLSPLFPMLMENIFDCLLDGRSSTSPHLLRSEESVSLEREREGDRLKVVLPSGLQRTIIAGTAAPFFTDTAKVGIYTIKAKRERSFAVNLLDEGESKIAPFISPEGPQAAHAATASSSPMIIEFWKPLAFTGLLLLLLEWSCFHRRRQ
ncbi:MAG: VWA domain-containing protein [Candidatus Eremiobacteraeota bacterium]|nr:VWA domain-containing protein [Candidatus Eremiobacteraeota bacterium]